MMTHQQVMKRLFNDVDSLCAEHLCLQYKRFSMYVWVLVIFVFLDFSCFRFHFTYHLN